MAREDKYYLKNPNLRIARFSDYGISDKTSSPREVIKDFLGDKASLYNLDILIAGYVDMVNEELRSLGIRMIGDKFYSSRCKESNVEGFKIVKGAIAGLDLDELIAEYGPDAYDYSAQSPDLLLGEFKDFNFRGETPEGIVMDYFIRWAKSDYDLLHVARAYRRTTGRKLAGIPVKLVGWKFYLDRPVDPAARKRYENRVREVIAEIKLDDVVNEYGAKRRIPGKST